MMSVLAISIHRMKNHPSIPGMPIEYCKGNLIILKSDVNNNSRNRVSSWNTEKKKMSVVQRGHDSALSSPSSSSSSSSDGFKRFNSVLHASRSHSLGTREGTARSLSASSSGTLSDSLLMPNAYKVDIAGSRCVVNISMEDASEDEARLRLDDRLTPVDYPKTVRFFQEQNDARSTYLRALNLLSESLSGLTNETDASEWDAFRNTMHKQKQQWRRRCCISEDLRRENKWRPDFEHTGIQGVLRSAKARIMSILRKIFPCLARK